MKSKILVFIDWYLPGFRAGGPVSSIRNLVNSMSEYFDFYILTSDTDYGQDHPYQNIERDSWVELSEGVKVYYASKTDRKKKILALARELNAQYWYITGAYSFLFSIMPVWVSRKSKKQQIILAPRGMLSGHALGVKTIKKRVFLLLAKTFGLYRNVKFQATNEQEKIDIEKLFPRRDVITLPNFPYVSNLKAPASVVKKPGDLSLIIPGRIAPEKNTLGALKILEAFSKSEYFNNRLSIRCLLYGQIYDQAYWNKCLDVIRKLPEQIAASYEGSLDPESLIQQIRKSHILYSPTHGENFGHAIAEGLAEGRPVLISDQTPWQDIESKRSGWSLPLDDQESFLKVLNYCTLLDQEQYERLSSDCFNYMKTHMNIEQLITGYKRIFVP